MKVVKVCVEENSVSGKEGNGNGVRNEMCEVR